VKRTVFVSEPTELSSSQRLLSRQWHQRLSERGFGVIRLGRDRYQKDPWRLVLQYLDTADGVLVLGFRQLTIESAIWRRDTAEQASVSDATWTSPWLHIETGMALASGLPVLAAAESGVHEGVFAHDTRIGQLAGTSLEAPCADVVDRWALTVAARTRRSMAS
jgi:hypothetical protein